MNKQESWMPTDAEIREVFPAMTYAQRSKVAIIAAFAGKKAIAEERNRPVPEVGWLIEEAGNPPRWWAGTRYGWTKEADKAVRFCRESDAMRVVESMDWANPVDIFVTDPWWG